MVNANVVISVSAVLVALLITIVFLLTGGDDGAVMVRVGGTLSNAAGDTTSSEMYYCAGDHCNYYGMDPNAEGFPGYLALVAVKDGSKTFLTEFSLGYSFEFDDGKLQACHQVSGAPSVGEVAAAGTGETGSVLTIGDNTFTITSVEKDTSDITQASVFGLKIPSPLECNSAAVSTSLDAGRRLEAAETAEETERRLDSTNSGYDNWMLAFYTYKTNSGIPTDFTAWSGTDEVYSPDVYAGWSVATGLSVTYTETWKNLPFWTTNSIGAAPDIDSYSTYADINEDHTATVGKCENAGSYAKVFVNGNDIAIGLAGTDLFVISLSLDDIGDVEDDINSWEVRVGAHTYHAGFFEYVSRVDDCVMAIVDALRDQGKNLKYVVGHSLGGAAAANWESMHPDYAPSDGTHTYGGPLTIGNGESCSVPGIRYFNELDPVASDGSPGIISFTHLKHNVETAVKGHEECIREGWWSCKEYGMVATSVGCEDDTSLTASGNLWIFGKYIPNPLVAIYNLCTAHMSYAEWVPGHP